ncbi:MAG TPA: 2Fe-2S iron-sulfur cluster binding domain-containing protein [Polyangiaceae bacterium LLY-WYZ-14_1]|nr:2Fe-2S iron-sulfur cluster binding domain-containing protein [Polyangiaceae bacterium LLY-WYZ-14_1]
MPLVRFGEQVFEADPGVRLRDAILREGASPHNGRARLVNCKGFGTCGTCAVQVEGDVDPPSAREKLRLQVPPHDPSRGLRLACQVKVGQGDLVVKKYPGFWGQETDKPPVVG